MSINEGPVFNFTEKSRLDFELLISDISSNFVHSNGAQLDSLINDSLQRILDFLSLDRVALWQEEGPTSQRYILTHLKFKPGCGPEVMPFLTTDSFPYLTSELVSGRETSYARIDDLPDEAATDKATLKQFADEYSAMAFPLFNGEKVYGFLTLGLVKELMWPERLIPRLRVVAHVFSGALLRKKSDEKLHHSLQELEKLKSQLERENVYLRQEIKVRSASSKIVYKSLAMNEVLSKVEQVAGTNATVLISGETGTGKEIIASAIHELSSRSQRTMVSVNCGAIPSALVESELFGREKGAYTGALSRQIGRFEFADSSTIFLDEVSELPMEIQVKLLRVLQERVIERLGNPKPIKIDVRVIAATNQNLEKAIQDGKFRQDLYYRLNVFPIEIPPLRERREDIPNLVWSFVSELSTELGKKIEDISKKSMEALMNYSWPGNVRELRNAVERAMIVSNLPELYIEIPKSSASSQIASGLTLREVEIQHILKALENSGWRIRGKDGAAEKLGMKPTTLETRMAKLGISRSENNKP